MSIEAFDAESEESDQTIGFGAMVLAPFVALVIGGLLIYYTETSWQLAAQSWTSPLLWGAVLGALTFAIVLLITRLPLSQALRDVCKELVPIFKDISLWQVVVLSLMAGVGEELLFRGFLQQWLAGPLSVGLAIGIAAVVFGLLHFASLSYFLLTTALGAAFGIAYHLNGSLLLIMSWHAFYDLLAIWVFSRYPRLLGIDGVS